jgi:valyl-tRNA synthetase
MISGWCLAADKSKMSKSKGNVITPVGLIEEKGADVVRFWASTSRLGSDTAFSEDVLKIGRKLVTKLWNATKFAAIHLDKLQDKPGTALQDVQRKVITEPLDLWILTRLKRSVSIATQQNDKYEYCDARVAVEDFFWNDFCDNYLELVKGRVYAEDKRITQAEQKSAVYTIYHCLDGILRLFAPIVPHITDELYTHIFDDKVVAGGSVHARGNWPNADDYPEDVKFEQAGITTVDVLNAVRKLKAERNVSIKWPLNFIAINGDNAEQQLAGFSRDLRNVTSATEILFTARVATEGKGLSTKTDDGKFEVTAEFAENASNGDTA